MIKLLLISMCLGTALGSPFQRFEVFDDVDNDAEVVDAGEPLPGTRNLSEKRMPLLRLHAPGAYLADPLHGTRNLGERVQVAISYELPGLANLDEKSIPVAVINRRGL